MSILVGGPSTPGPTLNPALSGVELCNLKLHCLENFTRAMTLSLYVPSRSDFTSPDRENQQNYIIYE